jgi:CubicO group peptidase (beta-lactamase class C family)
MANEELGKPNSADAAFFIGSLTKQFTGAAIMKLQMMGKLSVSDSIKEFIPGLPDETGTITIHQLLTHTSGLPADIGTLSEVLTREEFFNRLLQIKVAPDQKGRYSYSHTGYNVLGLLIETISGSDYESFLQQYLFKPAGMKHTGYRIPDWSSIAVTHGYSFCNDWGRPMDSGWLDDGPSWTRRASGGMLSTLNDLYLWHLALLGNQILDEPSKKAYYHPEPTVIISSNSTMGYGWRIITSTRNTEVIAHNGWNGRFYADFLRYSSEDVTIILLSNRYRKGNEGMPIEIAKCIFKSPYEPEIQGRNTVCLDSLPNNRLGSLTKEFLNVMANGTRIDFEKFIRKDLATHLVRKYSNETLVDSLLSMRKQSGQVKVRQVRIYDNRIMTLDVFQLANNQEASFQLVFDENEDYRIRGISFSGPDNRN